MEGKEDVCTTGILIDIEDNGNAAVDTESHLNLYNTANDPESVPSSGNCKTSLCVADEFNNRHLGDGLNAKRGMLSIPNGGWKTPSPKSMKKIWKEASKIIDQLHASPIESTEVLLVDEDFPASGCLDESSPESEKVSASNENSTKDASSPPTFSMTVSLGESQPELEKVTEINENSCAQFSSNEDGCDGSSSESEKLSKGNEDSTKSTIPMSSVSCASVTEVVDPVASGTADVKLENPVPKNITESNKLSEPTEPVSASCKVMTMLGSALKTPVKSSKVINKENASETKSRICSGLKFPFSNKKLFKRNVLGESNEKGDGIVKPEPKLENTLTKTCTDVILEKRNNLSKEVISRNSSIISNRGNSIILPRTSNALQQSSTQRKPALYKTSSVGETPTAPKFVRRANSFQTNIGKNLTIKRPEPSLEQKSFISSKDTVKKISNLKTPSESNIKTLKSRMSIGQTPNNGICTPLRRSNSLTKRSGAYSSQIPGPGISLSTRKISIVAEDNVHVFKRPVVSTSSRVRFSSRLDLPSPLPSEMNDNLSRKLFPDLQAPRKRY